MEKFVIRGGRKLSGKVKIESAKNAVLPIMAGAVLTREEVVIKHCPKICDVLNMVLILESLGVKTHFIGEDLIINASGLLGCSIPFSLMKELRSSIFTVGALVGRVGRAEFFLPGGCDLGERPINYHLTGLKSLGVDFDIKDGAITCKGKVKGGTVVLPYPSVGATENLILASVISKGTTLIKNVAKEPEIVDLISFLNSMGARIYGAGTSSVFIEGVDSLSGTVYSPLPDRIETGTFIISALITGGNIEIYNANTQNISFLTEKICNNTCKIDRVNDIIHINGGKGLLPFNVVTGPFPEFPTDMQAQCMALASVIKGTSTIEETVFSERFKHVDNLLKMGANILIKGNLATIKGVKRLHGENLYATDLRGGASVCLAALSAEGTSEVFGVEHIDRGYLAFDGKLKSLGADVERIF